MQPNGRQGSTWTQQQASLLCAALLRRAVYLEVLASYVEAGQWIGSVRAVLVVANMPCVTAVFAQGWPAFVPHPADMA